MCGETSYLGPLTIAITVRVLDNIFLLPSSLLEHLRSSSRSTRYNMVLYLGGACGAVVAPFKQLGLLPGHGVTNHVPPSNEHMIVEGFETHWGFEPQHSGKYKQRAPSL